MNRRAVTPPILYEWLPVVVATSLCLFIGSCRSTHEATSPDEGFFQPLHSADRRQAASSPRVDSYQRVSFQRIAVDTLPGVFKQQAPAIESVTTRAKPPITLQQPDRPDSAQISASNVRRWGETIPIAQPVPLSLDVIRSAFLAGNYKSVADECEEKLRQGVSKTEEDQYRYMLGKSYYHLKRYDLAAASLKKVVNWKGTKLKPDAWYVLGLMYRELGVNRQARSYFESVVREAPGSDLATRARAQLGSIAPKK